MEDQQRWRELAALVSPGTVLREGLDRIVHGRTGALIVLGGSAQVSPLVTGGFAIDVPLTATRLRELAKMDGAILLNDDLTRISHAAAHLMPDPTMPSEETGTRHRTADMLSRQTGVPAVTVSASMAAIALFVGGTRHRLQPPEHLLTRTNQGLATLEQYRARLTEAAERLTALEIQDATTVYDVAVVARRVELVRRLAEDLAAEVVELGSEGRMVQLQLQELMDGFEVMSDSLARDYGTGENRLLLSGLAEADSEELRDPATVARKIRLIPGTLDARLPARGYRQLARLTRLSPTQAEALVDRFGSLQALLGAQTAELVEVVEPRTARLVREGLSRLAEAALGQDGPN